MRTLILLLLLSISSFAQDMPHVPRNIQAPNVAADFWTQWGSINPRMCCCVKITPAVGTAVGLTSNTRDMTLPGHGGITFKSTPGLTPSVFEAALDEPANLEMTGIYQTGIFEHADVIAGKWDNAAFEVFSVCWDNVNLGELLHAKGNLGVIKDYQDYFVVEGRGPIARLSNDVNKVTSRFCRVKEFRDAECGHVAATVTIDAVAFNVTQTSVTGNPYQGESYDHIVFDSSAFAGNDPTSGAQFLLWLALWSNGKITATDGPNAGVSREIAAASESIGGFPYATFVLKRGFPFVVDTTTTFNLVMGCNRTLEDCRKFSNVVNRRAEDYVPGIEAITRLPLS